MLDTILAKQGEEELDHPITFTRFQNGKELYHNRVGNIVYGVCTIEIFRNYLLGSHFKFFIDHPTLQSLINKLVLEGKTCH